MSRFIDRRTFVLSLMCAGLGVSSRSSAQKVLRSKGRVLVAGGSGKTGLHIMAILEEYGFSARGLTTDVERAKSKALERNYDWVAVDVRNPETMTAAFEDVDCIISAIGSARNNSEDITPETIDYGGVRNLVDLAVANQLKQFVLISSAGATISDPEHYFNRMSGNSLIWKFKGEEYLRASSLAYTIIRPGNLNLKEKDYEPRTRGLVFDQGDRIFGNRGAIIHRADLADVCVAALSDEAAVQKTLEIYVDENATVGNWRKNGFARLEPDAIRT